MKKIALSVAILLAGIVGLQAQVFDFKLTNDTGYNIINMYVSPSAADEWGDDVLGEDILEDGSYVDVSFPSDIEMALLAFDVSEYDLKVIDEDGDEFVYTALKLAELYEITLTINDNGVGVAKWK